MSENPSLKPFLIRIDEIDEALNLVTTSHACVFLAHLQSGLHLGIVFFGIIEHPFTMRLFDLLWLFEVLRNPIANLAISDALADHFDQLLGLRSSRFEPQSIEPFAKIGLIIRMQLAGQMEPDLVN